MRLLGGGGGKGDAVSFEEVFFFFFLDKRVCMYGRGSREGSKNDMIEKSPSRVAKAVFCKKEQKQLNATMQKSKNNLPTANKKKEKSRRKNSPFPIAIASAP